MSPKPPEVSTASSTLICELDDWDDSDQQDKNSGWLLSLTFWIVLFSATTLYASVALAPKLSVHLNLESRYYTNQVRLVSLQQKIENLGRVARALETESEFAAELARIDFDAQRPGDERISVDPDLRLDVHASSRSITVRAKSMRWYESLVNTMAKDAQLRAFALTGAVVSVILAFTFLHESQQNRIQFGIYALLKRYSQRYQAAD